MKSDTERKIRYQSKLHKKRDFLNAHLSKELRQALKKRSEALKKGDKVKVMRGNHNGKEARVTRVKYQESKVYLEGLFHRTARAKEVPVPFQPSNLMIIEIAKEGKKPVKVEKPKDVEKIADEKPKKEIEKPEQKVKNKGDDLDG